jgi:hypothetical protein
MFEAYKIAVSVTLMNHASHGLSLLAKDFARTGAEVKKLKGEITTLKNSALKGGLLLGAGLGMASMLKAPLDEVKKYQVEVTKLSTLGFGDVINAQAEKFARSMKIMGSSTRENMTIVTDAMAVTKDLDKSKMIAPMLAQMAFSSKALYGEEEGGSRAKKGLDAVKLLENRNGFSSEAESTSQMNLIQKAINGSRNRVDPSQILTALRRGGAAFADRSNEQMYLGSEGLIQDMTASGYGTAAMSMYQGFVQGRSTQRASKEMARIGLIGNSDLVTAGFKSGAMTGTDTLKKDGELRFVMDKLLPQFRKAGVTSDSNTQEQNDVAVNAEFGKITSNRKVTQLLSTIYKNRHLLEEQYRVNLGADGVAETNAKAGKTLSGQEVALQANFHSLLLELGTVALPMAIKSLQFINPLLEKLSGWIEKNGNVAGPLLVAFTGLAGALAFGGVVYLLSAAFTGLGLVFSGLSAVLVANPIGLAIAAIGTAAYLLYTNWETIGPKLQFIWSSTVGGFGRLLDWVASVVGRIRSMIPEFLGGTTDVPNAVRTGNGAGQTVVHNINLDGEQIHRSVTKAGARDLARPDAGIHLPDFGLSAPRSSGSFAK